MKYWCTKISVAKPEGRKIWQGLYLYKNRRKTRRYCYEICNNNLRTVFMLTTEGRVVGLLCAQNCRHYFLKKAEHFLTGWETVNFQRAICFIKLVLLHGCLVVLARDQHKLDYSWRWLACLVLYRTEMSDVLSEVAVCKDYWINVRHCDWEESGQTQGFLGDERQRSDSSYRCSWYCWT